MTIYMTINDIHSNQTLKSRKEKQYDFYFEKNITDF